MSIDNNNTHNHTIKDELLFHIDTYLAVVMFSVIFVVGVVGNFSLVLIYVKHRSMRNAPNTFIFSLAVADLLVIVFYVPLISVIFIYDSYPWSEEMCIFTDFISDFGTGLSVFTLMALSAERYFVIVDPFKKFKVHGVYFVCLSLALIWIAAFGFAFYESFFYSELVDLGNVSFCAYTNTDITIFNYTLESVTNNFSKEESKSKFMPTMKAIIYFIIPLIVIAVFYSLMARSLLASTREFLPESLNYAQNDMRTRKRKSIAFMVLTCAVVFFVCFLPYHAYKLWFAFDEDALYKLNNWYILIRILSLCLGFLHSCVNPVVLYYAQGKTGQYMKYYLFCGQKPTEPPATYSSRLSRTNVCEVYKSITKRCNRCTTCEMVLWATRHRATIKSV